MGFQGPMTINHFQRAVDQYPDYRIVIYSSETHQPYPEGIFVGVNYDVEHETETSIFIFFPLQNNHFSWIQNMQRYYRSTNSHEDHHFCAKCLGWIRGRKFNTHQCIYEFRCFDCGDYKNVWSATSRRSCSRYQKLSEMWKRNGFWKIVSNYLKLGVGPFSGRSFYEPEEIKENMDSRIGIFKNKSIIKIQIGISNKICMNIVKLLLWLCQKL